MIGNFSVRYVRKQVWSISCTCARERSASILGAYLYRDPSIKIYIYHKKLNKSGNKICELDFLYHFFKSKLRIVKKIWVENFIFLKSKNWIKFNGLSILNLYFYARTHTHSHTYIQYWNKNFFLPNNFSFLLSIFVWKVLNNHHKKL